MEVNQILQVVQLIQPHTHKLRGNVGMEQDRDPLKRPSYETQIGNTTIKIRSALPFMTTDEQKKWWEDNDSLPEVRMFKRAWIESLIQAAESAQKCDSA